MEKAKNFAIRNPRHEEIITVERKSDTGVFANGKWYNGNKFKPELLATMEVGGTYALTLSTTTKADGKQYINLVGVETVCASSVKSNPTPPQNMSAQTFLDKDERRQRLIVRQSSLAQAVAYSEGQLDVFVDEQTKELLEVAEKFCNWVFEVDKVEPLKEVELPEEDTSNEANPLDTL